MRLFSTVLIVLLGALSVSAENHLPLVIFSNIKKLQENIFTTQSELVQNYAESLKNLNSKTIVIEIQTPHSLTQTIQLIRDGSKSLKSFSEIFNNKEKTFSTSYLNYDAQSLVEEIAKIINHKIYSYDINSNFIQEHLNSLRSSKNAIELIKTPLNQLSKLDKIIQKDLELLRQSDVESINFVLLFDQKLDNFRLLQQEEETQTLVKGDPVTDSIKSLSNISASALFGILFTGFFLYLLYVGTGTLLALETPAVFQRQVFAIGKVDA